MAKRTPKPKPTPPKKPARAEASNPAAAVKPPTRDKLLPKLTIFFFNKPLLTALIWLAITVFGLLSYTTLLKREGFPSVNIPVAFVSGTYFVNDAAKVDTQVAKPLTGLILQSAEVNSVRTSSAGNFFTAEIEYKEGTDAKAAAQNLETTVKASGKLPKTALVNYSVPYFGATGGDTEQIDVAISFFNDSADVKTADLAAKAKAAAKWLNDQHIEGVKSVFVKDPLQQVNDPATGKPVTVQRNFDRFGTQRLGRARFYNSVVIGVAAHKGTDVIKLDDRIRAKLQELKSVDGFAAYDTDISASFAPAIKENISELQRVLLEGLAAVLVVGSIVITIRASLIIVLSMVTVLLATLGFLYAIGYSLNVITLFALILGLALIVDDTIIMTEAIDAARNKTIDRTQAVRDATRKVSRAMVAATLTACLSFAPFLFVGGVLGSFIKAIPITIISSLLISLLIALLIIPFISRFLLLGKKHMGKHAEKEVAAGFEAKLADFIASPMLRSRHRRGRLFGVGITAVLIGLLFVAAGLYIFKQNVIFNIFPPTKDTNGVAVSLRYPPNTTIDKAEKIAADSEKIATEVLGDNFVKGSYYNTGDAQNSTLQIEIKPYGKRDVTSVQLVNAMQQRYNKDFTEARATVTQLDIGPPASAFIIQLSADKRAQAFKAAEDLSKFLESAELKRINGKAAHFKNVNISSRDQFTRAENKPVITVSADFDGNDTSTLVTLAKDKVNAEYTDAKLAQFGLPAGSLLYDLGQETENQESFKTLGIAFPFLLLAIFILLAFQFRSLLQPLLIFMAIPFSLFGVMFGLAITHNAFSFFTFLGVFALVGLSIKNTILLTDFANQARASGLPVIDSAVAALEERFRPLFATSVTAVVSLIPLALTSPFWEGLAVVLIFGLISSTFLVVTVFPYYYLGAEYLRLKVPRKAFFIWLILTGAATVLLAKYVHLGLGLAMIPLSFFVIPFQRYYMRRLNR